jgi:HEAT repeat protein
VTSDPPFALSTNDGDRMAEVQRLAREGASGTDALVLLLGEPSWVVRRAVVAALARLGTSAVGPLCGVLATQRGNETRLAAAVDALVASGGEVESAVLELAEKTETAAVLCDVAQILGRRKSSDVTAVLTRWCTHEDDNVAVAAIEAIGRIGGSVATRPLVAAVESGNFFRVFPAIMILGRTGDPRAVAPLTALLAEPHYAEEAAAALGRTGQLGGLPPLVGLLLGADASVRAGTRAIVDLHRRHFERSGDPESVPRLFAAAGTPEAISKMVRALGGASVEDTVALATVLGWMHDTAGVMALVALLDEDGEPAREAFQALRSIADDAEPLIRDAVRSGDSARRLRLLPLLGARRSVVSELVVCLRDVDPAVRAIACDGLGRIGDPSVVGVLFGLIGDADARVAQAALGAIQSLGSEEVKLNALAAARSPEARTRRAALRVLAYFAYPDGLDLLLEAIQDPDERIREAAVSGLVWLEDTRARAALLAAASHESVHTRAATLRALANSIPTSEVVGALVRGLTDADAWVRYYACQSLGKLRVTSATDEISRMLRDDAGQVRVAAVEAIARLGGAQALAVLDPASRADDPDVRRAALLGLGDLRRPGALPILLRAAESDSAATRLVAITALAESRAPEVMMALRHAAADADPRVRDEAFGVLAARPGQQATRWLIEQLGRSEDRERALNALANSVEGRIEGILTALEGADAARAPLLIEALMRMRRANANAAVESTLHLENVDARRAAAAALLALGTTSARKALIDATMVDPDDEVRRIAAAAL